MVDTGAAARVWEEAVGARWTGPPTWFHGDLSRGNLLLRDRRLRAVIDFGTCGVGDPACDLVIAWTTFVDGAREAFRAEVGLDDGTWARARGWAVWKALITLVPDRGEGREPDPEQVRVVDAVLADAQR